MLQVQGDVTYTALEPTKLILMPLNSSTNVTGANLFAKLQAEAENLRKEKKRNVYSGIHKYLYLVEGKPKYACLLDCTSQVISFPPITNANITKVSIFIYIFFYAMHKHKFTMRTVLSTQLW